MARYFARIIRALIVSLLGFGGGTGLMVFIMAIILFHSNKAFEYGVNAGMVFGGIFALFFVGVLLPLDLTAHLFLAKGDYKEIWELEQTREVVLDGTLKEVMQICRDALLGVQYMQAVSDIGDAENPTIKAAVGTSWRSYGEEMVVAIKADSESANKWHAFCTSRSLSKNVLFDYAKNYENVEQWRRNVNARLRS
jgi:hypothetical protein